MNRTSPYIRQISLEFAIAGSAPALAVFAACQVCFDLLKRFPFGFWNKPVDKGASQEADTSIDHERACRREGAVEKRESIGQYKGGAPEGRHRNRHAEASRAIWENL